MSECNLIIRKLTEGCQIQNTAVKSPRINNKLLIKAGSFLSWLCSCPYPALASFGSFTHLGQLAPFQIWNLTLHSTTQPTWLQGTISRGLHANALSCTCPCHQAYSIRWSSRLGSSQYRLSHREGQNEISGGNTKKDMIKIPLPFSFLHSMDDCYFTKKKGMPTPSSYTKKTNPDSIQFLMTT